VSGSSGRLIVKNTEPKKKDWPGKVFENPLLCYEEAMLEFVAASEAGGRRLRTEDQAEETAREIRRKLKLEDSQLRKERREVREKRRLEDVAWKG
jgi:predicted Rossmann-fold nucleotide-binding protein